jgi:hypothetical protein
MAVEHLSLLVGPTLATLAVLLFQTQHRCLQATHLMLVTMNLTMTTQLANGDFALNAGANFTGPRWSGPLVDGLGRLFLQVISS